MKRLLATAIILSAFFSTNASAWFFFFLPGAVTGKIADAFTGAEGDNCVGQNSKVGDNIRLANGDVKSIKSLSGTSTRCTNTALPIRALLGDVSAAPPAIPTPTYGSPVPSPTSSVYTPPEAVTVPDASINMPSGWNIDPLSPSQRKAGIFMSAYNRDTDTKLLFNLTQRVVGSDMGAYVATQREGRASVLWQSEATNIIQTKINNIDAWRYTVTGKGSSGSQVTYLTTFLYSDQGVVVLDIWTPTATFVAQRAAFEKLAENITGLTPSASFAAAPPSQPNPPTAQSVVSEKPNAPVEVPTAVPDQAVLPVTRPTISQGGNAQRLRDLNALLKDGVINQKDFDAKKQEILKSM